MSTANPDKNLKNTGGSPPPDAGAPRRRARRDRGRATRTPTNPDTEAWTAERIRALGATTDLRTAARIFGLSANTAYDLAHRDQFPVPVIRAGRQYRVSVPAVLAVLDTAPSRDSAPPDGAT